MMYRLLRPLLFRMDPEVAHQRVLNLGKYLSGSWLSKVISFFYSYDHPGLETEFCNIRFKNPVGLAAGFDKDADLLGFLHCLGFGFAEVGSVTARPCDGNPKPRLFRLEGRTLLNLMGLNNIGADELERKLSGRAFTLPFGINIAKTNDPGIVGERAIGDICYSFRKLGNVGDYFTLNVSCPNADRTFEDRAALSELLSEIKKLGIGKPVLLKLSADMSRKSLDGILESSAVDGYVIANTSRGLSGEPVRKRSTELIRYVSSYNKSIIGVGGIDSAEAAKEKLDAGAKLLQLYTGLVYGGPGLVKKIKKGIVGERLG